jgi:hypothetical protein
MGCGIWIWRVWIDLDTVSNGGRGYEIWAVICIHCTHSFIGHIGIYGLFHLYYLHILLFVHANGASMKQVKPYQVLSSE